MQKSVVSLLIYVVVAVVVWNFSFGFVKGGGDLCSENSGSCNDCTSAGCCFCEADRSCVNAGNCEIECPTNATISPKSYFECCGINDDCESCASESGCGWVPDDRECMMDYYCTELGYTCLTDPDQCCVNLNEETCAASGNISCFVCEEQGGECIECDPEIENCEAQCPVIVTTTTTTTGNGGENRGGSGGDDSGTTIGIIVGVVGGFIIILMVITGVLVGGAIVIWFLIMRRRKVLEEAGGL